MTAEDLHRRDLLHWAYWPYSVAWFGIRINTYANSAPLSRPERPALPTMHIPLKAGMSIGMLLIRSSS